MPEAGPRRRHRDRWASGPAARAGTPTDDLSAALALASLDALELRRRVGDRLPVGARGAALPALRLVLGGVGGGVRRAGRVRGRGDEGGVAVVAHARAVAVIGGGLVGRRRGPSLRGAVGLGAVLGVPADVVAVVAARLVEVVGVGRFFDGGRGGDGREVGVGGGVVGTVGVDLVNRGLVLHVGGLVLDGGGGRVLDDHGDRRRLDRGGVV